MSGSLLILRWRGQSDKKPGIPTTYHALKDVAHIPFSVYLLLTPLEKGFVNLDDQKNALTTLKDRIDGARSSLDPSLFSTEQIARQQKILEASGSLVMTTLKTGTVARGALLAFASDMGPLMLRNAAEAGCEQIKTTHAQMMVWKQQLTPKEWASLIVVNRARHQARYRNAATQYFHWLFGDEGSTWSYPGESMRVIYAESLAPNEEASDELAMVLIDAEASDAFFGNRWRLSEDILSEGAASCIGKLPTQDRAY